MAKINPPVQLIEPIETEAQLPVDYSLVSSPVSEDINKRETEKDSMTLWDQVGRKTAALFQGAEGSALGIAQTATNVFGYKEEDYKKQAEGTTYQSIYDTMNADDKNRVMEVYHDFNKLTGVSNTGNFQEAVKSVYRTSSYTQGQDFDAMFGQMYGFNLEKMKPQIERLQEKKEWLNKWQDEFDMEAIEPEGVIENVLVGLGQSAVYMPMLALGVPGAAVGAGLMYADIAGNTYHNMVRNGVPEDRARDYAIKNAAWQTPIEFIADKLLLKGMARSIGAGKFAARSAAEGLANVSATELVDKTFTSTIRKTIDRAIYGSAAKESMVGIGSQLLEEVIQNYPDTYYMMAAQNPDLTVGELLNKSVLNWNTLYDGVEQGIYAMLAGGLATGATVGTHAALVKWGSGVTPGQHEINKAKVEKATEVILKDLSGQKLSPEEKRLVEEVNMSVPSAQIEDMIVSNAGNILYQADSPAEPVRQSIRENLAKQYGKNSKVPQMVLTILDRISLSMAQKTNMKPEEFYTTYLPQVLSGEQATFNPDGSVSVNFQKADPSISTNLESGNKIKAYRAMQVIDGKLYPVMSAKINGKLREPIQLGVWEQAIENPELIDKKGKFKLDKGNKKSINARYNPYFHASLSPLNDQFSEAYQRPNIVTVEVEIPESELTSGYKAEGAKDAVGEVDWKSGPVSSKLPANKTRKVILSRYSKAVRIVPDSEVAQNIASLLEGENIAIPENTVTPSLKNELLKLGVEISNPNNTNIYYQGKKGATVFNPQTFAQTIHLFETADVSTIIHETGHVLTRLIAEFDAEGWKNLSSWLKADPEKGFDGLTEDQKENLAKAFTTYMHEGIAPSLHTQGVFKYMKAALLKIWESIREFVEINDEVRDTFDSWLTLDKERQQDPMYAMREWFRSEKITDIKTSMIQTYGDIDTKAKSKIMKAAKDKVRELYRKKQAEVMIEARKVVKADPMYKLTDKIKSLGGINEEEVRALGGLKEVDINSLKKAGIVTQDGKAPLDEIASDNDFTDGMEMIGAIIARPLTRNGAVLNLYNEMFHEWELTLPVELQTVGINKDMIDEQVRVINDILGTVTDKDELKATREDMGKPIEQLSREYDMLEKAVKKNPMEARNTYMTQILELKKKQAQVVDAIYRKLQARESRQKNIKRINRVRKMKQLKNEWGTQLNSILGRYWKISSKAARSPEAFFADMMGSDWNKGILGSYYNNLPPQRDKGERLTNSQIVAILNFAETLLFHSKKFSEEAKAKHKEECAQIAEDIYTFRNKDIPEPSKPTPDETNRERSSGIKDKMVSALLIPEKIVKHLGDKAVQVLSRPLLDAANLEFALRERFEDRRRDILHPFYSQRGWAEKEYTINGQTYRKGTLVMIALNNGTEKNRKCLIEGYKWNPDVDIETQIEDCVNTLSKEEKKMVDDIFDLLGEFWPHLEKMHFRLTGTQLKKEEGKYFPIMIDWIELKRSVDPSVYDKLKKEYDENPMSQFIQFNPNHSQREERTGSNYPIRLSLDCITIHGDKCIRDIAYTEALQQARSFFNEPSIRSAIINNVGLDAYDIINTWYNDIAVPYSNNTTFGTVVNFIKGRVSSGMLLAKVTTLTQQLSALNQTAVVYGWPKTIKYTLETWLDMAINNKSSQIYEKSAYMKSRYMYIERDLDVLLRSGYLGKGAVGLQKIREKFAGFIGMMDSLASIPTWELAYDEYYSKNASGNEIDAIAYADSIVRETQGSGRWIDRSEIMRSKEGLKMAVTMFYTFQNSIFNQAWGIIDNRAQGKISRYQAAKSMMMLYLGGAFLAQLLSQGELPEEKEWWTVPTNYMASTVPLLRDAAYYFNQKVVMNKTWQAYRVTPMQTPVEQLVQAFRDVAKEYEDHQNGESVEKVKLALDAWNIFGFATGLPVSQVNISVTGAMELLNGETDDLRRLLWYTKKEED